MLVLFTELGGIKHNYELSDDISKAVGTALFVVKTTQRAMKRDMTKQDLRALLAMEQAKVASLATVISGKCDLQGRINVIEAFPLLEHAHVMDVRVQAGGLLYLSALWYHCVTQSCETLGVNYWYDMRFESPAWCYFHFLQQLRPPTDEDD